MAENFTNQDAFNREKPLGEAGIDGSSSYYQSGEYTGTTETTEQSSHLERLGVCKRKKSDMHDWFFTKVSLVDNLHEELWAEFWEESEELLDHLQDQMDDCKTSKSKWVVHETPKWFNEFMMVRDISRYGSDSHVNLVRHIGSEGLYVMRSVFKQKVQEEQRQLLYSAIREEVGLLLVASEYPCMCNLLKVFEDELAVHLIQEYYPAGDMEALILSSKRPQSDKAIYSWFIAMCQAVYPYHEISSSFNNIAFERFVIGPDCTEEVKHVMLVDFGIVRNFTRSNRPTSRTHQDFFFYAPESYGPRFGTPADVWALGVCLFAMKFNFPPFFSLRRNIFKYKKEVENLVTKTGFINETKEGNGNWFPDDERCDILLQNLISKMLMQDARKRITLKQVFEHPFMTQFYSREDLLLYVIQDIFQFMSTPFYVRKFTEALIAKGDLMSQEEYQLYWEAYNRLDDGALGDDVQGDGALNKESLLDLLWQQFSFDMTEEFAQEIVNYCGNKDGDLQIEYMIAAKLLTHIRCHTFEFHDVFLEFDPDKSGKVDPKEFSEGVATLLGDKMTAKDKQKVHDEYKAQCDNLEITGMSFKNFLNTMFNTSDDILTDAMTTTGREKSHSVSV